MTDMRENLLEIAQQCEKATGPSLQLDRAIQVAVLGEPRPNVLPKNYSASLDAAMTVVDDNGMSLIGPMMGSGLWQATCGEDGEHQADATTPALALCGAALRARAAQEIP